MKHNSKILLGELIASPEMTQKITIKVCFYMITAFKSQITKHEKSTFRRKSLGKSKLHNTYVMNFIMTVITPNESSWELSY